MPTHKITTRVENDGGDTIQQTSEVSSDQETNADISVPDASTDLQWDVTIDISDLKSFYLHSDQDVTVETNNGATPDDTFALKANMPIAWNTDSALPNPFASATDVTVLYITNASGSAATLKLRMLQDVTP